MLFRRLAYTCIIFALTFGLLNGASSGWSLGFRPEIVQAANVSAFELILAMNTLRMSYGLPALTEDPTVNAVAQATAETMAANQMSWHIGNVSGRLAAAGYGGGAKVWATENFAVGDHSIDEIMVIWSDASHMIPAVNPAYCHVGAGVARSSNGRTYYVLQAAYTASQACGEYRPPEGLPAQSGGSSNGGSNSGSVPQLIVPVKKATADKDGRIFHLVESGQSFWAIAVAYKITINDLETWNNISRDAPLKVGQKLFVPGSNTKGYSTPTPVGMVLVKEPGADGKIFHVVQPYQTLFTISQAYKVSIDTILRLNGIQEDWPLQIEQELLISLGNEISSPSQRPLSAIEQLTPASDGRYYHTVQSGETLSWIAGHYEVSLQDLMAWNGLDGESIIRPDQRLVLLVTPPPTAVPAPSPTRDTQAVGYAVSSTPIAQSLTPTPAPHNEVGDSTTNTNKNTSGLFLTLAIGLALGGTFLLTYSIRKRR